jgi:preprotein translocase subunit SecY
VTSKFRQIFQPFLSIVPSIKPPTQELSTRTRYLWSFGIFIFYSFLLSTPLLGFRNGGVGDPFAFMRTITASQSGSLVQLGIGPLLVAGILLQFLLISNRIDINIDDPSDQSLYNCALKVIAISFTFIGINLLLISGVFGTDLTTLDQIIILFQLMFIGIIIIYLDEIIVKGWGVGSGISIFILCVVTLNIFQGLFQLQNILEGPVGANGESVTSARGLILAIFYWLTQRDPLTTFSSLFFRYSSNQADRLNLPSLSLVSLFSTLIFLFIFNYVASIKIRANSQELQMGETGKNFQINILYLLTIPILITTLIFSCFNFLAQLFWRGAGGEGTTNILVQFLGTFRIDTNTNQIVPTGGLTYFLTPPRALIGPLGVFDISGAGTLLPSLFRVLIYSFLFLISYIIMKRIVKASLDNPDVNKYFLLSIGIIMSEINNNGESREHYRIFNISEVMKVWGLFMIIIVIFGDIFGILGSSVGLYLCVVILREINDSRKIKGHRNLLNFYL